MQVSPITRNICVFFSQPVYLCSRRYIEYNINYLSIFTFAHVCVCVFFLLECACILIYTIETLYEYNTISHRNIFFRIFVMFSSSSSSSSVYINILFLSAEDHVLRIMARIVCMYHVKDKLNIKVVRFFRFFFFRGCMIVDSFFY